MELSRALLKDFAKAVNGDSKAAKTSTSVNGTAIVDSNGKKYVQIDGSDQITPISEITDVQNGDRVLVSVENHQAVVIGNYTYPPSARTANSALAAAEAAITEFNGIKADMITTDTLSAKLVEVGYITAEQANIAYGKITELESIAITTNNFEAKAAEINLLTVDQANANYLTATQADLKYATIDELNAKTVTAEEIQAAVAEVGYLKAEDITAENGSFNYLDSTVLDGKYASFGYLEANYATIDELNAKTVTAEEIQAAVAEVGYLTSIEADLKYANIELSNVEVESVGTLFARIGILEDMTVTNGYVTGVLNGVRINADVITAGTLSVDRLMVTGEDSIVYQINVASSGLSLAELADEKYQKYLNGTDIVAGSITADRITAGTITSNEIASGAITTDNLAALAVTAAKIDTVDLFAQDITATGTIRGVNLIGAHGSFSGDITATEGFIGGWNILSTLLYNDVIDVEGNIYTTVLQNVSNVIYLTEFYSTCSEITPSTSEFSYAVRVAPTGSWAYIDTYYAFSVKIPTDRLVHGTEYTIYIYDGYNKVEGQVAVYSIGKDPAVAMLSLDDEYGVETADMILDGIIIEGAVDTGEYDAPGDTESTTAKLNKYVKFTYDENYTNYRLMVGLKDMTAGASYDFIFSLASNTDTSYEDIVVSDGLDPMTVLGVKHEDVDGNITTPFYLLRDGTIYTESGLTVNGGVINFTGTDGNTWKINGPSSILQFHRNDVVKFQMGADGSFYAASSVWAEGGYLYSVSNGVTVQIGSQNSAWCHITNNADVPFYFNKGIHSAVGFAVYDTTTSLLSGKLTLGNSTYNDGFIELYSATPFIDFHFGESTADHTSRIIESASGTLNVNGVTMNSGRVTASNWLYSTGATGWYNSSYGGGMYQEDSTFVKVYGSKILYSYGRMLSYARAGSWIDGMSVRNAAFGNECQNSGSAYFPILAGKTQNSHVWNLGTYVDDVGFYGFYNGRTANATDWSCRWDSSTGYMYQSKDLWVQGTVNGLIVSTGANEAKCKVLNNYRHGGLCASTASNLGIYDWGNSNWVIRSASNQYCYIGDQSAMNAVFLSTVCCVTTTGNFRPTNTDGDALLGTSDRRWSWVYSSHSALTTSDEREKDILGYLDEDPRYKEYFMKLRPIRYRWKTNADDGRIQIGLGAQTSERMLTDSNITMEEFAGIMHDDLENPTSLGYMERYSICYQQFDTLTMLVTQDNTREIEKINYWKSDIDYQLQQLREENETLKLKIAELEALVA